MNLTVQESRMLEGGLGPLVRQAMEKTVEYGRVCGAERLCDVTMAHLFCGAHHWMEAAGSGDFDSIHSIMAFDSPERLPFDRVCPGCRCQADVFPIPAHNWEATGVEPSLVAVNQEYLDRFRAMGVSLAGTCVPYLAGFAPMPGEHYVSSESHAVLLMNSLWSARGQADGLEAGFWAAVCGKTPYWGLHDPANRKGNLIIRVDCDLTTVHDWDLLGHAAGLRIPPLTVPIFVGFPRTDIHKLKSCAASMATTSGAELAHFVGLTPEAPDLATALAPGTSKEEVVVSRKDLEDSRAFLSSGRRLDVDYVSVGCPHLTVHQLGEVAAFLAGARVSDRTVLHVWTAPPFKDVADRMGYTKTIEASGASLLTGSCPLVSGRVPSGAKTLAFDSAKQAHYIKSELEAEVLYGSQEDCLKSALSGRWEGAAG